MRHLCRIHFYWENYFFFSFTSRDIGYFQISWSLVESGYTQVCLQLSLWPHDTGTSKSHTSAGQLCLATAPNRYSLPRHARGPVNTSFWLLYYLHSVSIFWFRHFGLFQVFACSRVWVVFLQLALMNLTLAPSWPPFDFFIWQMTQSLQLMIQAQAFLVLLPENFFKRRTKCTIL